MKRFTVILLTIIICFACCGCSANEADDNEMLTVYASVYPIYDFCQKIGGDRAEVISCAPKSAEPHDWEPTAQNIIDFGKADILAYNGAGLEHWVNKAQDTLKDTSLVFVNASEGIEAVNGGDSHLWLSPKLAKEQMQNIADAFCEKDPANADYYKSNLSHYSNELDKLDEAYRDVAGGFSQKNIITSHNAFGYLCKEYGLTQVTAEGAVAGSEPSPADMAKIVDLANQNGIKVVFYADGESTSTAEALAKEIGGKIYPLYPVEKLSDEQEKNGSDYFSLMNENLEILKEVLK